MSTDININKNIYNSDGTLTANRILSMDGKNLRIENDNIAGGSFQVQIGEYNTAPLEYSLLYQDKGSLQIDVADDNTLEANTVQVNPNTFQVTIQDTNALTNTNWVQDGDSFNAFAIDSNSGWQTELEIEPNQAVLRSDFGVLYGLAKVGFADVQIEVYNGMDQKVQQTTQIGSYTSFCENTTSGNNSTLLQTESSISLTSTDGVNISFIDCNLVAPAIQFTDGVNSSSVIVNSGGVLINSQYYLPIAAGAAGQVLTSTILGQTAFQALPTEIQLAASDETTALTTGTAKVTFRMPYAMTLTAIRASLSTAQASGTIFTVDVNQGGSSIISTKITIDNTEKTSTTAAAPPVISTSALTDDAEITIDIDQIGDGTAAGLKITLIGTRA